MFLIVRLVKGSSRIEPARRLIAQVWRSRRVLETGLEEVGGGRVMCWPVRDLMVMELGFESETLRVLDVDPWSSSGEPAIRRLVREVGP